MKIETQIVVVAFIIPFLCLVIIILSMLLINYFL